MSSLAHDKQDMQRGWNARAVRNPFFYVETTHWDGDIGRFFELGEASARRLIDPVLQRRAPARDLALDLGCGLGRFSRALARRFSSVMAVDVSDRMIAEAKRLQSDGEFKNITFEKSDGVILPAAKNAVDFVWSYEVFQHIPTRQSIAANLDEIARVLRPGGIAMIHLKTGYQRPAVHAVLHHLPQWAIGIAVRIAGLDPLMAERTFSGAAPLMHEEIRVLFGTSRLSVLEICPDPTHAPGTRSFAIATKAP